MGTLCAEISDTSCRLLASISFATASRVLQLQSVAEETQRSLRLRAVKIGPELRLVALLSSDFGAVVDDHNQQTERAIDRLLYSGPLRGEQLIRFQRLGPFTAAITVEQEALSGRSGLNEDVTGCVVWPTAHALSAHLCAHPEVVLGRKVVELGAGTGLVGIVAAALGASKVVLTDLPSCLPLLQRNSKRNQSLCGEIEVRELRWGSEAQKDLVSSFDVVICCEVVYQHDEETSAALVQSIDALLADGGCCLVAYEFRDGLMEDMAFFDKANDVFEVETLSLGQYGFGLAPDEDDQSRLLYIYTRK